MMKIAISTTTFGNEDQAPLAYLRKKGYQPVLNPHRRQVTVDELVMLAADAVGLIAGTEKITGETLSRLPSLRVISRCGAGGDNVDMAGARKRGIKVYTTPDAPTGAVAELTVGLIIGLLRAIPSADRSMHAGRWKKEMGSLLNGKRVGIIGYGRIGKKVGELLAGFGCEIVYYDIKDTGSFEKKEPSRSLGLKELLSTSDIITIHASAGHGGVIIDSDAIGLMKKSAYLVNTSRGAAIDEEALYRALKTGRLSGAALDVYNTEPYTGPFTECENAILTPHIGSYARETRIIMEMEAVKNLISGLEEAE